MENELMNREIAVIVLRKRDDFSIEFNDVGQPDIYKMPIIVDGDEPVAFNREFIRHNLQIQKIAQGEHESGTIVKDKLYPLTCAVLTDFDGYDIFLGLGHHTVKDFCEDLKVWTTKEYEKYIQKR